MLKLKLNILYLIYCLISLIYQVSSIEDKCPDIKTKAQWGGRLASGVTYQVRPIRYVSIHHTATEECNTFVECSEFIQNIQSYQMNELQFEDIGYNFLIGNDGMVYEGVGWGVRGAHTYGYNMNGTGIAFIGNYMTKLPSRNALNAAKRLLACGVKKGELDRRYQLFGASQAIATKSPGLTLYNEIMTWKNWVPSL